MVCVGGEEMDKNISEGIFKKRNANSLIQVSNPGHLYPSGDNRYT